MLHHHFVAANVLYTFYGFGYLSASILKATRSISFRGTPGSPSTRTSLEAQNCFSIWDRCNGADMSDFDFLFNIPCPSPGFFFYKQNRKCNKNTVKYLIMELFLYWEEGGQTFVTIASLSWFLQKVFDFRFFCFLPVSLTCLWVCVIVIVCIYNHTLQLQLQFLNNPVTIMGIKSPKAFYCYCHLKCF